MSLQGSTHISLLKELEISRTTWRYKHSAPMGPKLIRFMISRIGWLTFGERAFSAHASLRAWVSRRH